MKWLSKNHGVIWDGLCCAVGVATFHSGFEGVAALTKPAKPYRRVIMDSIVEPSNAEQAEWLNTTREYVQSLQAQLAQYEADAVHTCGEACQRPLCVLRAENAALREGITKIAEGDVPRVIFDHWRKDKAVSKHDLCPHQLAMYQDCGNCISDYARALLGKEQS